MCSKKVYSAIKINYQEDQNMFSITELPYRQKSPYDRQEIQKSYQLELTIELSNQFIGCMLSVGPGGYFNDHFQYYTRELFIHNSLNKPHPLFHAEKICQLILEKINTTFALYKNIPVSYMNICVKYGGRKKESLQYNLTVENAVAKLEKKINQVKAHVKVLQQVDLDEVTLNENETVADEGCTLF